MNSLIQKTSSSLIALLSATSLIACGGGGASPENAYAATSPTAPASMDATAAAAAAVAATAPAVISEAAPVVENKAAPVLVADAGLPNALAATVTAIPADNTGGTATVAPVKAPVVITNLALESTTSLAQMNVPVTFGQVFAKGDLMPGMTVYGVLGDGTKVPLQIDAKARHADGSLRHAVISTVLPQLASHQLQMLSLNKITATAKAQQNTPAALIGAGFRAAVSIKIGDQTYSASADELLKSAKYTTWLSGPLVNEWMVSAPLKTAQGVAHPHLSARFAIRSYTGLNKARVDVAVENTWAYEPNPQNYTYDAQITVGSDVSYAKTGLTHFHHARWRKLAWWGAAPEVHVKHNQAYLIASRAVPNYDQSVVVAETALTALTKKFSGAAAEPMGTGLGLAYMPTTGGRSDIGLMPSWAAMYLLSMDKRAKDAMLGTADLAGSWSAHYRDRRTDRPISLVDYPYMTLLGRADDTLNPVTKQKEMFPACATTTACINSNTVDAAHQPAFAYLPYLVTGDYYYLEELQFYSMWNLFSSPPSYRAYVKGLLWSNQVRGQGWSLRTLGEAAYITPDADPFKAQFATFLSNNLDWYNATYTNNPAANTLGIMDEHAMAYANGTGIGPWQDDFFTSAVGHLVELGFTKADPLLAWKARFPVQRMTAQGACWIDAARYTMVIRDSKTTPVYSTMAQVYKASHTAEFSALACASTDMATALKLKVAEMTGYSSSDAGFPSNMQPALAYSASAIPNTGPAAWRVFMGRSVKPNYGLGPQFAIVPR